MSSEPDRATPGGAYEPRAQEPPPTPVDGGPGAVSDSADPGDRVGGPRHPVGVAMAVLVVLALLVLAALIGVAVVNLWFDEPGGQPPEAAAVAAR